MLRFLDLVTFLLMRLAYFAASAFTFGTIGGDPESLSMWRERREERREGGE